MTPHTRLLPVPAAPTRALLPTPSPGASQPPRRIPPHRPAAARRAGAAAPNTRPVGGGHVHPVDMAGVQPATIHTHAVAPGPRVRADCAPWGNEENP